MQQFFGWMSQVVLALALFIGFIYAKRTRAVTLRRALTINGDRELA